MNILKLTLLSLILSGPALLAEPLPSSPPAAADPLAEALPILRAKYADFKALNYKPGDKLIDLVARSGGKITLKAPETLISAVPALNGIVTLPDNVCYWRLASFTPEKSWSDVATHLMQAAPSATGVILDLRSNVAADDYHGASLVLSFFTSGDPSLIAYQADSTGSLGVSIESRYRFHSPIVVLTNTDTTGAAEALAACLQADGALVVGRPTAGKMGIFDEQKLSSGQVLRYFVAPVWHLPADAVFTFPTHHSLPWGQPVTPDITVKVDDRTERAALVLIKDNHIDDVIQESPERHRLSEASLVKGQDPEWDEYLASLEQRPVLLSLPVIHDVALVRALDSIKAIGLSQRTIPTQATANASLPASTSVQ